SGSLLALLCLTWMSRHLRSHGAKRVFLVISAFDQKHYLAELIRNVHSILDQRGYSLELKIPHRDYSTVGQAHCLKQIIKHRGDYIGGLVVPVIAKNSDRTQADLINFCRNVATPVIFIDVEPFDNEQ